jgi:branched-chain amino acid transport system permease protein
MKRLSFPHWLAWSAFAVALVAAPLVFNESASLSLLSQIGTTMIFALSYNMLLGQGGMLSFGHAMYSGLGGFFAVHAMNLAAQGEIWMPVALIPLAGGLAGMAFGILFGYVTTRRSGTTFAMITLGMVELVFACALMFPDFFGGEGGVSANRVYGDAWFGISYGPQVEVYYLIAFWLFLSTIGMYAFTRTPLGRIINAVRDNAERAAFIGYDPQWARYLTFILSAFFAGIAGGLSAINFEIATAENVTALRSGAVLLFTVIGGTGVFLGPMIGAVIGVFLTVMLSDFTRAWQLYLGLFFIAIVMYAPGGVAGILMANLRLIRHGRFGQVWPSLCMACATAAMALLGVVMLIEMTYHRSMESTNGSGMALFGVSIDTATITPWSIAAVLVLGGGWTFQRALPVFRRAWEGAHASIPEGWS